MKALTHRGIRHGIDPVEPAPLHTDAARDDSVPLGGAERAQLGTPASTWPKQPGWQSHNRAPRKGRARPTRTLQLANTPQVIEFSHVKNWGGSGCAANSGRGSFLKLNSLLAAESNLGVE